MSKTRITQISKRRLHRLKKSKKKTLSLSQVTVYTTNKETEIHLAKGLLENKGIFCTVEPQPVRVGIYGVRFV